MRLVLAGHRIEAVSIGGIETCFQIPGLDVCLDIGRCPEGAASQRTLLLTHGHIDHAAGLPYYVAHRALMHMAPPRIYCPAEAAQHLADVLAAWARLQVSSERCTLVAALPGDTIELGRGHFARPFESPHRIETIGYTIFRRTPKLLPELRGLTEAEIAARAKRGERVQEEIVTPEICFPGDTRIDVVDTEPAVRAAKVLLLECTFVGTSVSPEYARRTGHVHLDQIAERADVFENEVILLTHFSKRASAEEIRDAVARLPAKLRERVQLLLHEL